MARPLIVVMVAVLGAACRPDGRREDQLPAEVQERFLGDVRALRDRGCACPDLACFDPIIEEMLRPTSRPEGVVSPETDRAASALLDELRGCQRKLLDASAAGRP